MSHGYALNMEVAPGVWRLGDHFVNWWLVGEGGRFTVIDGGLPGQWGQLHASLDQVGAASDAVEAVVLTHGHSDHFGTMDRLRSETAARVYLHRADTALASGRPKVALAALLQLWHTSARKTLLAYLKQGALSTKPVVDASALPDGRLDIPARPRVIHTPGHTAGSCTLLLENRGVALVGDALVTLDPFTGRTGPRLLPAWDNDDYSQALTSLEILGTLPAHIVLPGHGEPWHGAMADAATAARRAGGAGILG